MIAKPRPSRREPPRFATETQGGFHANCARRKATARLRGGCAYGASMPSGATITSPRADTRTQEAFSASWREFVRRVGKSEQRGNAEAARHAEPPVAHEAAIFHLFEIIRYCLIANNL